MKKIIVLVMALVSGSIINAMASETYYLTVPNDGMSAYSGPYARITVDLTGTNVATITEYAGDPNYLIGGTQALDLNTTGGDATASNFSDASYYQPGQP